jgi:F-type H+-transporting ATPase subunit b
MKLNALPTLLALTALSATPLNAAEGGILTPEGGLMTWTIIVFGLVLFVLWKFAYPPILGAVEAREQRIRELLTAASRDREEAEQLLVQQRQEMEGVRVRTQEIMAESKAAGERARDDILAEARREQEEMLSRAQREIRQATDRAIEQVRAEAVTLAIAAAEKLIAKNLDDESNRRMVRDYLAQFEGEGAHVPAGV